MYERKHSKHNSKKFTADNKPDSHNSQVSPDTKCLPDTVVGPLNIGIKMDRGYVKVWRKLSDSSIYNDTPCFRVFFDLLLQSKWRPGTKKIFKRKEIELQRGQLTIGRIQLAKKLGISESSVYRALIKCQNVYRCIRLESDSKWTLVTILNWDSYQNSESEKEQQANNKRTTSEHTLRKKECNNKEKDFKNNVHVESKFERIWKQYPNRLGKKQAEKHFNASVKTDKDFERIEFALSNYVKSEKVIKGFIQNGSTWFNNWEDWVDYKPQFNGRPMTSAQRINMQRLNDFDNSESGDDNGQENI